MNNKTSSSSSKKISSDPSSTNYSKQIKNKANEKSPFGQTEPSNTTTYK
jgi:hypothetical protein